jgi:hypothetical protein
MIFALASAAQFLEILSKAVDRSLSQEAIMGSC